MQHKHILTARKYTLFDCIRLPFSYLPGLMSIITAYHITHALLPALTIIVMANFIDIATQIIGDYRPIGDIFLPAGLLIAIQAYPRIVDFGLNFVTHKIPLKLRETVRVEVFEKVAAVDYKYIESSDSLDTMHRVILDPESNVVFGYYRLANIINMIVRMLSILMIFALHVWYSVPIILATAIPVLFLARRAGKKEYEAEKESSPHKRRFEYYANVLTDRQMVLERTLFGYSNYVGEKADKTFKKSHNIQKRVIKQNLFRRHSGGMISAIVVFTVMATFVGPVQAGIVSIGTFIALVAAGNTLAPLLSWNLPYQFQDLSKKREFFRDLTKVMNFEETKGGLDAPQNPPIILESLEFKNVRFSYPEMEAVVLNDISFTIEKGKHYALVGVNGSGKTTITKLITGLYNNFEGEILINGKNICEYTQAQLKSLTSVVFQDFAKYPVTLRENIAFGRAGETECTEQEWQHVLEFVALDGAANKLPKGIDTPLGKIKEDGVDLSGGQWQRVAMARSMMSTATFKILDEQPQHLTR